MKDLNFIIFSVVFAMSIYLTYRQINQISEKLKNLESSIKQIGLRCDENEKQMILVSNNKLNKTQNIIKEISNHNSQIPMDKEIKNLDILPDIERDDTDNIETKYNNYLNDEKFKEGENDEKLENLVTSNNCLLFTKNSCSFCTKAINYLEEVFAENGMDANQIKIVSLDDKNIFKEKLFTELKENTNLETVPNIFINKRHIGGFVELKSLEKETLINLIKNFKENLDDNMFLPNDDSYNNTENNSHFFENEELSKDNDKYPELPIQTLDSINQDNIDNDNDNENNIICVDLTDNKEKGEEDEMDNDLSETDEVNDWKKTGDNNELENNSHNAITETKDENSVLQNNTNETDNILKNTLEDKVSANPIENSSNNESIDNEVSDTEKSYEEENPNKLTYDDLSKLTLRELRTIARERCLPTNRNKEPLIQCLLSS